MPATREDIEWAAQAMRDGRSLEFIASVLETSQRKARNLIFGIGVARDDRHHNPGRPRSTPQLESQREEPRERPKVQKIADWCLEPVDRRKVLLRRRFARHWDMIWHLRRCGMCGRTLRQIYGSEALIWSVGGGIDEEIEQC